MIHTEKIKLIAFDLDGTLTQHKTPLSGENRDILFQLKEKYSLLMAGAGSCERIFLQMNRFPIDIIGNYGMQYARFNEKSGCIETVKDEKCPCDRESVDERVTYLRKKFGFTEFKGDNTEFHDSGCVTIPILGTAADINDKLAFDPDRKKRRAIYSFVKELFPEYTVFVGGSSSFDMAPAPFDKAYALGEYTKENGILHCETVYIGDDYGEGGNDESVYKSDFNFIKIDNYRDFPDIIKRNGLL